MHRSDATDGGWRLPAKELDGAVAQAIISFLRDEIRIVDALDLTDFTPDRLRTSLRRAAAAADDLGDEQPKRQVRLLHLLLDRVTLHPGSIHIALKRCELGSLVFGKTSSAAKNPNYLIDLTIPAALKRRGVEAKLIVSAPQEAVAAPDKSLTALIAKARRWLDRLTVGKIGSIREIAHREGIDASEVSRIIQLAFLAPDIVEAVLAGRQPTELTPRRLMRIGELPLDWAHQRRLLDFSASTTLPNSDTINPKN
jgi:site-specific DNA recombinase